MYLMCIHHLLTNCQTVGVGILSYQLQQQKIVAGVIDKPKVLLATEI